MKEKEESKTTNLAEGNGEDSSWKISENFQRNCKEMSEFNDFNLSLDLNLNLGSDTDYDCCKA